MININMTLTIYLVGKSLLSRFLGEKENQREYDDPDPDHPKSILFCFFA